MLGVRPFLISLFNILRLLVGSHEINFLLRFTFFDPEIYSPISPKETLQEIYILRLLAGSRAINSCAD